MITISLHFWSIVVGFFIGIIVSGFAMFALLYGDRWSDGFGEGFRDGTKYQESKEKPKVDE